MNWLDLVIIVVVLVGAASGIRRGFLRGVLDIALVLAGLLAGAVAYRPAADLLERLLDHSGVAVNVLGFALVALLVQGFLSLILGATLGSGIAFARAVGPVRAIDEALGLLPGLVKGAVVATLLVLAVSLVPLTGAVDTALARSYLAQGMLTRVARTTSWAQARTGLDLTDFTVMTEPKGEGGIRLPFRVSEGLEVSTRDEDEMLRLVNEERARRGLAPLVADPALREVAREHSEEMLRLGYFSHVSPVSGSPGDRLQTAGIVYTVAGENLAYAPTVDIAHRSLMHSEGHRANILSSDFSRVGIGVITAPTGGKMFTQEFAGG